MFGAPIAALPPKANVPGLSVDQATEIKYIFKFIHDALAAGLTVDQAIARLQAAGHAADLLVSTRLMLTGLAVRPLRPWYKKWETYAIAGGVVAAGVGGVMIGRAG